MFEELTGVGWLVRSTVIGMRGGEGIRRRERAGGRVEERKATERERYGGQAIKTASDKERRSGREEMP